MTYEKLAKRLGTKGRGQTEQVFVKTFDPWIRENIAPVSRLPLDEQDVGVNMILFRFFDSLEYYDENEGTIEQWLRHLAVFAVADVKRQRDQGCKPSSKALNVALARLAEIRHREMFSSAETDHEIECVLKRLGITLKPEMLRRLIAILSTDGVGDYIQRAAESLRINPGTLHKWWHDFKVRHGEKQDHSSQETHPARCDHYKGMLIVDNQEAEWCRIHRLVSGLVECIDIARDFSESLSAVRRSMKRKHAYDVVILDKVLDSEDGWDVFHAMRDANYPGPIFLVSNFVSTKDREMARGTSGLYLLEKPYSDAKDESTFRESIAQVIAA